MQLTPAADNTKVLMLLCVHMIILINIVGLLRVLEF